MSKAVPPAVPASVSAFVYDSIVIEIQPMTDNEPHQHQLNELRELLNRYQICKDSQIHFVIRSPFETDNRTWYVPQCKAFERTHRILHDRDPRDRNLVLWMGFFPGVFLDPRYITTIGLQWGDTSTLIMGLTTGNSKRVTTMFHEILHAIGMVDLACRKEEPTNPDRPTHCNDNTCTMFWRVPITPHLCTKCQEDLHHLRR